MVSAFSGSHQDAIKKGFLDRKTRNLGDDHYWQMPYLPLDPMDIGRNYEAVIRVNSQSGKGGAAWVILQSLELDLPRGLQVAFSKIVQQEADAVSRELSPREITALFKRTYHIDENPKFTLVDYNITADRSRSPAPRDGKALNTRDLRRWFDGVVAVDGVEKSVKGSGTGPISSFASALRTLGPDLDIVDYKVRIQVFIVFITV